ncbi:SGNH/GDSL hydrolase family protein [Nocardioides albertanoniae]|uniref:SGNH/GDSL hydrolase family protein n=1 Tax=Nocardioides albertanoniae TaxID=1175486 RepID=UPI001FE6599F|nr:SGNH/GDSL hydrolase family protein [Nocardioides albertanoniae]
MHIASSSASAAAGEPYVALGDSYASGVGTRSYIDDGTTCKRSPLAYASLISAAKGYSLNFRACSGARVPDVTNNQISALSTSTKFVTISIGGNDAGFVDVVTECALPAWASDCPGAVAGAQNYIRNTLPGSLGNLYSQISSRAPGAKVVVVGYPKLFMGEDCNAGTYFSPEDEALLNDTAVLLNDTTASRASAAGFTYVNPISRFTGHAVCDDVEWVNGLSSPIEESYHANAAGHRDGFTPLVSPPLTGAATATSPAVIADAEAAGPAQAAKQRTYAARDRHIEPEVFQPPSRELLEKLADERGVDLDAWLATH